MPGHAEGEGVEPAASAHAAFRSTSHFAGLNGLRCFAVIAVVWHHCYVAGWLPLERGFLGVDLFFVLSGFLIATLLRRERTANGTIALGQFWVRRALRLLPALYGLIALLALYYAIDPDRPRAARFFAGLPANLFFYANWWPHDTGVPGLWSLATEEQFYLIWPVIERLGAALAWPFLLLAMAANQALNFGLLDPVLSGLPRAPSDYEIVDATYMPICLGIALALLLDRRSTFELLRRALGRPIAPWLALVGLAVLIALSPADMRGWPRLIAQLLMTGLLCGIVLAPSAALTRGLEWPPIGRIGRISYGIYLYHAWAIPPASRLVEGLGYRHHVPVFFLTLMLTLMLTLVAAELSYRMLEAPALRFARRFRARRGVSGEEAVGASS